MTDTSVVQAKAESETYFQALFPLQNIGDYTGHNDEVDAFRHAYVSAVLAYERGDAISGALGWALETSERMVPTYQNGQLVSEPANEYDMDNYNNHQGLSVADEIAPSSTNYKDLIATAVATKLNNGELSVIDPHFATSTSGHYTEADAQADKISAAGYKTVLASFRSDWDPNNSAHPGDTVTPAGYGRILPAFVTTAETPWNTAPTMASPLVLDLTSAHTGITLTTFNASTTTTFFDIDQSGFATQTAWVGSNMGLLCRDLNGNGKIDNGGELFGSPTVDGFALLASLDSNGDHRIDHYDSAWGTLNVWVDANGDAVTQSGELHTMADLGIASIDLAAVAASTSTISGNQISHTSFFTFTSGTTAAIDDAWFVHDKTNSFYTGDYTLDPETLLLPDLRGFGILPELVTSESQDSVLKGDVISFSSAFSYSSFADPATLHDTIDSILYRWAGVDGVDPGSRGNAFDAQKLEFMEHLFGNDYFGKFYLPHSDPTSTPAIYLNEAWTKLETSMAALLMLQTEVGQAIYGGTAEYDPVTGTATGDMTISHPAVNALQAAASGSGVDAVLFWHEVGQFIDNTKGVGHLTATETGWLDDAVQATAPGVTWAEVSVPGAVVVPGTDYYGTSGNDIIIAGNGNDSVYGTGGNDVLSGGSGNDLIIAGSGSDIIHGDGGDDVIYAYAGDDTIYGETGNNAIYAADGADSIYGGSGNDLLYGGAGNDTITGGGGSDTIFGEEGNDIMSPGASDSNVYGGAGDDTYVYTSGNSVFDEYDMGGSGTDTILLPTGIALGDLGYSVVVNAAGFDTNLVISIGSLGTIQIPQFFSPGGGLSGSYALIETVTFANSTTHTLGDFTALNIYGSNDNDSIYPIQNLTHQDIDKTIYGYGGNDFINAGNGNNIIDGGAGNDTIQTGTGNTLYYASPGFDHIRDGGGTDTIQMPDGITASDIHLVHQYNSDYALEITIDGLGQIVVDTQFYSSTNTVEQIKFGDNSTLNLLTQQVESVGTTGNETVAGIYSGASLDNIIDGRGGNDTLHAGSGNDAYVFEPGHSTVSDSGGTDSIIFGESWSSADISIYRSGISGGNLVLEDVNGNTMTITSQFLGSGGMVEHAVFSDSTNLNLATMAMETHGTSGDDNFFYSAGSQTDTIYGYGGNDQLYGGSGATTIYGGDGTDDLHAGSGNTTLEGGDGADSLHGGSGADTFVFTAGESGSDTVYSFNSAQGDKIDVHDVLVGYDPLTSAITDFVHITASGSNAILSVDANGATGGASFTQIATLSGMSSLAGHEADMLANHSLIAAAA